MSILRSKLAIIGGLVAALSAVVAFAAMGTGAFFSGDASGNINGNSGVLKLAPQTGQSLNLSFTSLFPGVTASYNNGPQQYVVTDSDGPQVAYICMDPPAAISGVDNSKLTETATLSIAGTASVIAGPVSPGGSNSCVELTNDAAPSGVVQVTNGTILKGLVLASLDSSADNTWQNQIIGGTVHIVVTQPGAPAPTS